MRWALVVAVLVAVLAAIPTAPADTGSRFPVGVSGPLGAVATESYAASRVGRAVLEDGGNAIDAAVATVFAMGVARPQSCGIGGGGFLVYRSHTGARRALDFRETAGAAMRTDHFTGPGLHRTFTGRLTVGVPGTVAGMASALQRYGTISLREAIAPAERLARRGFRVPASLSAAMEANARRLQLFPAARAQFLRGGNEAYAPGSVLVQRELAATLRRLQRGGPDVFYGGTIAKRIVRDFRAPREQTNDPGILTVRDFERYEAKWREPLATRYRDQLVIGMPPPTSGGIAVIQMLNLLEGFDLRALGQSSADSLHLIAEAQKLAFADRNAYVADPDFVDVPTQTLTSPGYADARRGEISRTQAGTYGPGLGPRPVRIASAGNATGTTTHISIIDRRRAAVSVTCTIEQEFGSAVVAPGTGFLLNNELTDFSAPGTANEPAPFKRPRSSMSPTIVVGADQRPILVHGAAGGVRIIMGALLPIVNMVDYDNGVGAAIDVERIDASSGALAIEDARVAPGVLAELERRGHRLIREGEYAIRPRVNAAGEDPIQPGLAPDRADFVVAASDPRTDQASVVQRER